MFLRRGSSLASPRARDGRGENPARWAQPRASRRGAAGPERTPEPLEPRLTPEEQQRLGKLAARAREVGGEGAEASGGTGPGIAG